MIVTRRYERRDIPLMIRYLREGLKTFHYNSILFDEDKVKFLLEGNLTNRGFFCQVVVDDETGDICGALCASTSQFMFSREVYAQDHVTYIRPGKGGLNIVTRLVADYVQWAKDRRVRQIRWSQSSGFKIEKFKHLAERLGFEQIGTVFNMEVGK